MRGLGAIAALALLLTSTAARAAEYVWLEAEHALGLHGHWSPRNPPPPGLTTWAIAGPGVAAEWSQGGESEWSSIALPARASGASVRFRVEVPSSGPHALWVRYADYQRKEEVFGIRLLQAGRVVHQAELGKTAVLPEDDEVKLMWGWAFGWGQTRAQLLAGPLEIELFAAAPTQAARHLDALLLTDDLAYRPRGRQKPPFAAFALLEAARQRPAPTALAPLATPAPGFAVAARWRTAPLGGPRGRPFRLLWNMPLHFWQQDAVPPEKRMRYPFNVHPGSGAKPPRSRGHVLEAFLERYGGQADVPIFRSPLITPVVHWNSAVAYLGNGAPFLAWLRQTGSPFGIVINYQLAPPRDTLGPRAGEVAANLDALRLRGQFVGYMSGESIAYVPQSPDLLPRLRAARSRREVLQRLHEHQTAGLRLKLEHAYGRPAPAQPWPEMISALDVDIASLAHTLAAWGEETLATEATANDPCYAMRFAFLRGAARQFGARWLWYQSSNFGDTSTNFATGGYLAGPETNYHHSHYDAFSGAGLVWYRKAYLAAYMAGAAGVYLEQGHDQFFIPSPGKNPIQLSPFGRITEELIQLAEKHPDRGVPYTPIAFLLDEGHGLHAQETDSGAFSLPADLNPDVLGYSTADASIREWLNLACYPLPVVEGEPLTSPRLSFINGLFGDVFDVLVSREAGAPSRPGRPSPTPASALASYRAVVLAGPVNLTTSWGRALRAFVEDGGTLVLNEGQAQGTGAALLGLPPASTGRWRTARRLVWQHGGPGETLASNAFRFRPTTGGTPLATSDDGQVVATVYRRGRGRLIVSGIENGLGIDQRATPLSAKLLLHLRAGLLPVEVEGVGGAARVGYGVNRTGRGWVVTLMNNRGNRKPQHGLGIPDRSQAATLRLVSRLPFRAADEWLSGQRLPVSHAAGHHTVQLEIPAGSVRIVELH
jgi:hypothetical protein